METQQTISIDSLQAQYLRYVSLLTGEPISALVRAAVEDWLDLKYSSAVFRIEERSGLPSTTGDDDQPETLHKAFENMVKNLEQLEVAAVSSRI